MSWIGLHKVTDAVFGITQKALYINIIKLCQVIYHYLSNFSELFS